MLTNELNKLIECLQLQVNCKTIAFSDIEHAASSLTINDEFDSLPDDVRGELFFSIIVSLRNPRRANSLQVYK